MLPIVVALTALVLAEKLALVAFAATVTDEGTVAAGLALLSVITAPPVGAGAVNDTVPVAD